LAQRGCTCTTYIAVDCEMLLPINPSFFLATYKWFDALLIACPFVLYLLPLRIVLTGYKLFLDDTEYNACNPIRRGHEVYKDTKRLPT